MTINIELNKVCYFPGELITGIITIFPSLEVFEPLMENPELVITLKEYQHFTYTIKHGKHSTTHTVSRTNELINSKINFKDIITPDYSAGFKIPISLQISKEAYPTIFFEFDSRYVRHYFTVEVPNCAKRTKLIVIRNVFPQKVLSKNINAKNEFSKSKFLSDKGSLSCNIKMPKNYFFYDEEIPFEINIDCSKLDLKIKSLAVSLSRKERRNYATDYTKIMFYESSEIVSKIIKLEKGLANYSISDSINFPNTSKYVSVYPPKVYEEYEKHGLYEVNDEKIHLRLYPSSRLGIISVEYFLKIKFNFDSLFTSNEKIKIPLYFTENNSLNPSLKNKVLDCTTFNYDSIDNSNQNNDNDDNSD